MKSIFENSSETYVLANSTVVTYPSLSTGIFKWVLQPSDVWKRLKELRDVNL